MDINVGGIVTCLTPLNTEYNKSADFIDKGIGMQEHFSFQYCHYNPELQRHSAELPRHGAELLRHGAELLRLVPRLAWFDECTTKHLTRPLEVHVVAISFSVFNNFKLNIDVDMQSGYSCPNSIFPQL